jgi:hypothetical protein
MAENFAESGDFHVTFRFFYVPYSTTWTDGFTSPPKEGVLRMFSPEKSEGFSRV